MKNEKNYDFLKRMQAFHTPGRRCVSTCPNGMVEVTAAWRIRIAAEPSAAEVRAAEDFRDYLRVSMDVDVEVVKSDTAMPQEIFFTDRQTDVVRGAYEIAVSADRIVVAGDDFRGVLRGNIALEDAMNLAEGPCLFPGEKRYEPVLKARIIHSGCGIDDFCDWQLDAIRHAGFTAIDIFVRDWDVNGKREKCDIADIIDRAEAYGLDTVLYNYLRCFIHPDDPDADGVLDGVYGELFRRYPKAWGISLVGESLEFPSKDPRTTGKRFRDSVEDGIPDSRPSPGWFPCEDYPRLLQKIVNSIQRVKPDTNIVFSTYNWSYLTPELREGFLKVAPKGLTINIAYEMQRTKKIDGVQFAVMDYTAGCAEPGEYFRTEAAAAAANGLKIRVCSNTGGQAWDFGALPYTPVPQLWLRRMRVLKDYALNYGAETFYEGHHYGWWPNVANDLMKALYSHREADFDDEAFLRQLARRDYGTAEVNEVWKLWSEALTHIVTSNEDQYGPLRTGASYPFVFKTNITRTLMDKNIPFPCNPGAMFGNGIIKSNYHPFENTLQSPGMMRYPVDLRELATLLQLWNCGMEILQALIPQMPAGRKRDNGLRLQAMGRYIVGTINTVINVKKWYIANMKLLNSTDTAESDALLDEMLQLIDVERENVKSVIPAVELDSRLGWEPSMEYVCDKWHLEWKLRQLDMAVKEIGIYRTVLHV